ncbi:MAG: diaminopimelate epimerase [Ignavibacteriales bacterium]|nr:diaminopimelate epimerase [Ignavibacteriales bacterium]
MIQFSKMTGAGNDFVAVDNRESVIRDASRFAVVACDRRFGIGADGILLVGKSDKADFEMHYYNADGSHGGMCGNGGRCIAMFARQIGIFGGMKFSFVALGHLYTGTIDGEMVSLRMKDPSSLWLGDDVSVAEKKMKVHFVNTGSPHCVIFEDENPGLLAPDFAAADIHVLGKTLRYHDRFAPEGTNVNFVKVLGISSIAIRTYERGVEEETLACGTGSIASAIVSAMLKNCISPVKVTTRSGETLTVSFFANGKEISEISLRGKAVKVFDGSIDYEQGEI